MTSDVLSKHDLTAYKLQLLNSIAPLLSPTLLPSPPLSNSDLPSASPPPSTTTLKRKGGEDAEPAATAQVGLGLVAASQTDDSPIKRIRLSPPSKASAMPEVRLSISKSSSTDIRPPPSLTTSLFPPSPVLAGARPPPPPPYSSSHWPSERLRKLAVSYREKARDLKRLGDKVARENTATKANLLSVVMLADALVLYVFAFWCDDHALKKVHSGNWSTIFGLLTFTRGAADKAGISLIGGLCNRLEAFIVHILSTNEQRSLVHRGVQAATVSPSLHPTPNLSSSTAQINDRSPQSQGSPSSAQSPPQPTITQPPTVSQDLLKSYTKASHEIFRYQRLWDESTTVLSASALSALYPQTWRLCVEANLDVPATSIVPPVKPWRFAWPVDLQQTMAIPHVVGFARALLEEWALKEGLDYQPQMIEE